MTVAYPIAQAWLSAGGELGCTTGAQNYDEFADEAEITSIITANPASTLAIEMPHHSPESKGRSFALCLDDAMSRLGRNKADGRFVPMENVAAMYRITTADGRTAYGVWCMVNTSEISTCADQPGLIIRNEDVFPDKVHERVSLIKKTRHLLSPVLLLQTVRGDDLHETLVSEIKVAGPPTIVDIDDNKSRHEVWVISTGATQERLLELAGGGELVVADGNHRSLAAQKAGLSRLLAVVTTPGSVRIDPYNRLVTEIPISQTRWLASLSEIGAHVVPIQGRPESPPTRGTVYLYTRDNSFAVTFPTDPHADYVENLDHSLVERQLFVKICGLEPGDKRISYIGGDYPASWLCDEVDAGRAELAVLIAPVSVGDFVAVNLARRKMPRKSTWFTPKARAGLVIADLSAED